MQVVVENITGGGSIVGTQAVSRSAPDGTSLLMTGNGTLSVAKHVNPSLPLDPERDVKAVTAVNTLPHWIVIRSDRPEKTFEQFVETIRRNPGKINISVNAVAGTAHLALASWAKAKGLDITIVPYRGSSAAMVDLLGGITSAHVDVVGSSLQFVKAGKARALTLLQQNRIPEIPDVPAASQGLQIDSWHVLATSSGTPDATIDRIYRSVAAIAAEPDFQTYIRGLGYEVWTPPPAETQDTIARESRKYKELVKSTGIQVN
jgi:tripartite-type tricarboxylate transporter receptor subunit TctC